MEGIVRKFYEMTLCALEEENIDRFIEILFQRGKLFDRLKDCVLSESQLLELFELENSLQRKFEEERKKLLIQMDELSKKRKGLLNYSASYPFPPMPFFFQSKT